MSARTIPGVPTDGLKPSDLLWASIQNKPTVFPPSAHSHLAGDLPGSIAYRDQANSFSANQSINGSLFVSGSTWVGGVDSTALVRAVGIGTNGTVSLAAGTPGVTGLIQWNRANGIRQGYMGFDGGNNISLVNEQGGAFVSSNNIYVSANNSGFFSNTNGSTGGFYVSSGDVVFRSGGIDNRLIVKSSGSVLIGGATDNGSKLQIAGELSLPQSQFNLDGSNSRWFSSINSLILQSNGGNIFFRTAGGQECITISNDGATKVENHSSNSSKPTLELYPRGGQAAPLLKADILTITGNGQLLRNGVNLWCNQGDSIVVNSDANTAEHGPHYYASNIPPGGVVGYGTRQGLSREYPTYGIQTFIPRYYEPYLWIRRQEAGSWESWTKASAGNADNLGGVAPSEYVRRDLPNIFTANQTVGGTGVGKLVLSQGTSLVSGYIQWLRSDGSRIAYMGYDAGNDISLVNEQAGALRVAGSLKSGTFTGSNYISSYYTDATDSNLGAQIYLGDDNFNNVTYSKSAPGIGAVYSTTTSVRGDLGVFGYTASSTTRQLLALFKAGGTPAIIPYCPLITQSTLEFKGATVANSNWWKTWAADSAAGNFYIQSNNSGRGIQVRATGGLLVNAISTGSALEIQQAGVSNFNVTSSGTISASGALTLGAYSSVGTSSGRLDLRPADGRVALYDGSQSYYMDFYSGNTRTVSISSDLLGKITTIGNVEAAKGVYAGESYLNYAGAGNNYLTGITYFRDPSTGYVSKAFVNSISGLVYGKQLNTDNALIDFSDGNTYFGNSSVVVRNPTTNVAGVTLGGISGTVTATGDTHKLGTTLIGTGAFGGSWSVITQDSTISASTYAFSANTLSGTYLNCPVGLQIAFRCANVDMLSMTQGQVNMFAAAGLRVRNDTNTADGMIVCGNIFASGNISGAAYSVKSLSTDPSTSDLATNYSRVFRNTSSGTVRLWANDGGVMKSVPLT